MASKNPASVPLKGKKSYESNFRFETKRSMSFDPEAPKCIDSASFPAGGYNWVMEFYPDGRKYACDDPLLASLILRLIHADNVTAKYSFKLLSKTGNSVTICQDEIFTFSRNEEDWCETFISFCKEAKD